MANTRSDVMANILASPPTLLSVRGSSGMVQSKRASAVSVAGDGAGHLYVLERFDALDRILAAYCNNTADAGWTDMNLGVWLSGDWTLADQTVVDADILVDGANRAAASDGKDELLGQGTNAFVESLEGTPLWQMAGVSAQPTPGTKYDVVVQSVGDPAGAGTMVWTFLYLAGH